MIFTFDPPDDAIWKCNEMANCGPEATAPSPPNVLNLDFLHDPSSGDVKLPPSAVTNLTIPVGERYTVRLRCNFDQVAGDLDYFGVLYPKRVSGIQGDGYAGYVHREPGQTGWEYRTLTGVLTGTGITGITPQLSVDGFASPGTGGGGTIMVDNLELVPFVDEEAKSMAVLLSAFGTRAVMALAQATLNTEIGYIKSETNTYVDLPAITGWRTYDSGQATPDVVEAEVFEVGETTFPHERYDQSTWNRANPRTRVMSKTPMRIAINHANRGDAAHSDATLLANEMAERSRLYGAALLRCFRNDPTCAQPSTVSVVPQSLRFSVHDASRLSDVVRRVGRVEFDFDLHLAETAIGETIASGGLLPSVTYMELP